MKVKVSEASGPALDWMVAMAEGDKVFRPRIGRPDDWDKVAYLADGSDDRWVVRVQNPHLARFVDWTYRPTTSWSQGGPIIERERIGLSSPFVVENEDGITFTRHDDWGASIRDVASQVGPTPLVAAMRCYVASKLGDTVDVPEELLA